MENKRLITDVKNEASSEDTRSSEETLSDDNIKPRGRGRPNKCPRRESPEPEQTSETFEIKAENNSNDDNTEPIPGSGGSVSLAFLTVNVSVAATNAARAASAAAHAAYGAAAASSNAVNAVYSAANVANHAASAASAAARVASIAAANAVAHDRLRFITRVGVMPGGHPRGRRGASRGAPSSSGPAPPHAG